MGAHKQIMNKRTFNKILNSCRNKEKTLLDLDKLVKLDSKTKTDLALHIIRMRGPVISQLIDPAFIDLSWLHCMGYLYTTKGKDFEFVHTGEHNII